MRSKRKGISVERFIRLVVRWSIAIPFWFWLAKPFFQKAVSTSQSAEMLSGGFAGLIFRGIVISLIILWLANIIARIFYVLPEWERLVLLRLGKSVGVRGPGIFLVPPFIYSVAAFIDIRIMTYEVTATRTLTNDNVPVDVTAAIEMEVEDPEKAAIDVQNYWKTTEWASMEALKSTIGSNDLRPLLSERENIASALKKEIDEAAKDYGVNVRAVRITDIAAPDTLIEELAVIARAERGAKAKQIQAEAEKEVAIALSEASKTLASQEQTMELRQLQALLEISKEESSTIIIYPADGLHGGSIAAATSGAEAALKSRKGLTTPQPEGEK